MSVNILLYVFLPFALQKYIKFSKYQPFCMGKEGKAMISVDVAEK